MYQHSFIATYAGDFTDAEQQCIEWVGQRYAWREVFIVRCTDYEFDIEVHGRNCHHEFSGRLLNLCMREFWRMGLVDDMKADWHTFHAVVEAQRAMVKAQARKRAKLPKRMNLEFLYTR